MPPEAFVAGGDGPVFPLTAWVFVDSDFLDLPFRETTNSVTYASKRVIGDLNFTYHLDMCLVASLPVGPVQCLDKCGIRIQVGR